MRALICHGDSDVRAYLEITFGLADFEVQLDDANADLVEQVLEFDPHVVVIDVALPSIDDGFSKLSRLRGDPRTTFAQVLVLSRHTAREIVIEALERGADDYVGMPFDADELLTRAFARARRDNARRLTRSVPSVRDSTWLQEPEGLDDPARTGLGPTARSDVETGATWDCFVSHASADKASFVEPLAEQLRASGLQVWYDEFELQLGDSIRDSIEQGLSRSQMGLVVLSRAFLAGRPWPARELDGLLAANKRVVPIFYDVAPDEVREVLPTLAGRYGIDARRKGLDATVDQLVEFIRISRHSK